MKWVIIPLVLFILICGCSSNQPTVAETNVTIVTPTPVAVTLTWIQTVGPTPTPTNDVRECYNRSLVEPPQFCYDYLYWVKPTPTVQGMGYTAKVWRNDSCVDLNRTSGECRQWGDNSYTAIFMKNQTIVRNLTGITATEIVAAGSYYNKSYDLNEIDGESFDFFINKYWDGTYPENKFNTSDFAPNPNVVVPIVNGTFNVDGFV